MFSSSSLFNNSTIDLYSFPFVFVSSLLKLNPVVLFCVLPLVNDEYVAHRYRTSLIQTSLHEWFLYTGKSVQNSLKIKKILINKTYHYVYSTNDDGGGNDHDLIVGFARTAIILMPVPGIPGVLMVILLIMIMIILGQSGVRGDDDVM